MNNEEQPNTAFSRQHSRVRKSPMKKAPNPSPNSSKFINPGCDHLLLKSMDWFQMWGNRQDTPIVVSSWEKQWCPLDFPSPNCNGSINWWMSHCSDISSWAVMAWRRPEMPMLDYQMDTEWIGIICCMIYIYIYHIMCIIIICIYIIFIICMYYIYLYSFYIYIYTVYLLYVYNCMYIYIYVPTRIAILQLIWIEKCGHTFLVHVGARHEAVSRWNDPPTLRPCLRILLVYQVGWK